MLRQAQHERRWWIGIAALLLATPAPAQQPTPYTRAIAAGYKALTLCNGLYYAGRTRAQVEAEELRGIYPEYDAIVPTLPAEADGEQVLVTFDPDLPPRRGTRALENGCQLNPIGAPPAQWHSWRSTGPRPRPPYPLPADPRPWPAGDGGIAPRPSSRLAAATAGAFTGSYGAGSHTTGVIILRDGRVAAERYGPGWGPFVSNRTWSVAKSMVGTMVGLARLDPTRPVAPTAWGNRLDPRRAITLDHLLRMASGLHSDTAGNRTDAIYFGGTAVREQVTGWPLEARPGTRFRYANNDTLLAALLLGAAKDVPGGGRPHELLFAPLGMRHTQAGTDWRGNYILSSQVWSTARDLARLGQFWLQDGVWQGRRLLPKGWMRYMTTASGPQPATGPGYGATLWLFGPAQGLPVGSYAAQGNRGQYVMVIPSERLVIVRRGEDPGSARFDIARFTADVIAAVR